MVVFSVGALPATGRRGVRGLGLRRFGRGAGRARGAGWLAHVGHVSDAPTRRHLDHAMHGAPGDPLHSGFADGVPDCALGGSGSRDHVADGVPARMPGRGG
jgi:hypothetical protein